LQKYENEYMFDIYLLFTLFKTIILPWVKEIGNHILAEQNKDKTNFKIFTNWVAG
jgi:hypothetical protein